MQYWREEKRFYWFFFTNDYSELQPFEQEKLLSPIYLIYCGFGLKMCEGSDSWLLQMSQFNWMNEIYKAADETIGNIQENVHAAMSIFSQLGYINIRKFT